MKLYLKIILSIIICFVLVIVGGIIFITNGLTGGSKLVISTVDTSKLGDGTYNGKYSGGRWSNEINVTIKDHKITGINIIKDVLFPDDKVTKELVDNVINKQNTNIDVISGATVTSKAYLKSIENALKK